jgi:hypothetical protein
MFGAVILSGRGEMKRWRGKGHSRGPAGLAALTALALLSPATAISPLPIVCRASATVDVKPGRGTRLQSWTIVMGGACSGDFDGGYAMGGKMFGTSQDSGLCGSGTMKNLSLHGTLRLTSAKGPAFDKTFSEVWSASTTTYPIVTPFLISGTLVETGAATSGAGVISTRIGGQCGPKSFNGSVIFSIRTT